MIYTEEEIKFLVKNYPIYGANYCARELNRKPSSITQKARGLKLKAGRRKHPSIQKVSVSQFLEIKTKEVAYFLGLFWADGYILHRIQNKSNSYIIKIEILSDDAKDIESILFKIGNWNIRKFTRKESKREMTSFITLNRDLYEFLYENDFKIKSKTDPSKILKKIPENLKKFFWKGYIDGDGFIKIKKYKTVKAILQFSGNINLDWNEVKKLFIKYKIDKIHHRKQKSDKGHKWSNIFIYGTNIARLKPIFVEYGFTRKSNEFKKIIEYFDPILKNKT